MCVTAYHANSKRNIVIDSGNMFSNRILSVKPSGVREIFELVKGDAINLGLGEPDYDPPEVVREALRKAVNNGMNKYGPTNGVVQLRESIADYYRRYGNDLTAENVIVTAGATEALMVISQSLFQEGDEVLIPEPGFVLYRPHTILAGAKPVAYNLVTERGFDLDVEAIKESINDRTKAIVVNSPSNPTGGVISEDSFRAIVDLSQDHGLWVISDEVYDNFIYEGEHRSFSNYLDNSIVVNSFSKSMATTGWRIGYLLARKDVIKQLSKMHYFTIACPSTPLQYAIHTAMPYIDDFLREMVPVFDRRRKLMVELLNQIPGFRCNMPRGAFFAFPSYDLKMSSVELAKRIAAAGVICSPGSAFGPSGEGYLRFSYAASDSDIRKGLSVVKEIVLELKEHPEKQ